MKKTSLLEFKYSSAHPFKTLYYLLEGNKLKMLLAMLVFIIKHSPVWIAPVITANIINIVSYPSKYSLHGLWINGIIMLIVTLQNIPTNTLCIRLISKSIRHLEAKLRASIIRRIHQLSIAFHKGYRSGRLQAKILRDVEVVERLYRYLILLIFQAVLNISVAFFLTLRREPLVVLFYLITVPLAIVIIHSFRGKIKKRNKEFRRGVEMMSASVSEMIELIPVTRAHAMEDMEIEKMNFYLENIKTKGLRLDVLNALFGATAWVTFRVFQLLCLITTGYMAYIGRVPIGDVVMYQSFFVMIVESVNMILNMYPEISKGFESINSIGEVLECPDIEQNEGKKPVDEVKGDFTFERVNFAYNSLNKKAIKDFSLDVKTGECIAFVGESGAGKSTIMNLIIGFYRSTKGRILLDGRDMNELDLRSYRRYLAVVPQDTILFSGSVRDNIAYGIKNVSQEKLLEAIQMANAAEFIEKLPHGLDTLLGEHGGKLSGGQRQRIAIARAFIRNPKVIIFDEATSSLDVISEMLIQQAMQRLAKNRTTFIVSHRLSTIRNADRIVVLKNGECIEMGTFEELMSRKGEFFRLKSLQN